MSQTIQSRVDASCPQELAWEQEWPTPSARQAAHPSRPGAHRPNEKKGTVLKCYSPSADSHRHPEHRVYEQVQYVFYSCSMLLVSYHNDLLTCHSKGPQLSTNQNSKELSVTTNISSPLIKNPAPRFVCCLYSLPYPK